MNRRPLTYLFFVVSPSIVFAQGTLPGFAYSPHWNEQVTTFTFGNDVRIHVNAPAKADPSHPAHLILYALPNGNTIEQTVGKNMHEGDDWHFNIQHIGAQTRRLRELVPDQIFIAAYLEASSKSWPSWRRSHPDAGRLILRMIDTLRTLVSSLRPRITVTGHSGGGSFTFGFLNAIDSIPSYVERIAFLDSNYGYDDSLSHGMKLVQWIRRDPKAVLSVLAYDDRWVTLNGKRVVGSDGGTYRATERMRSFFSPALPLTEERDSAFVIVRGLAGRLDLRIHRNPDTLILHTVLVERNGFLHSMLVGTPVSDRCDPLWGETRYRVWIQP